MNVPERISPILAHIVAYILALLLLVAVQPASANNWYQVEVIVFAHLNTNAVAEEWPAQPGIPDYQAMVELRRADEVAAQQISTAGQEAAGVPAAQTQMQTQTQTPTQTTGADAASEFVAVEDAPLAFLELPKQSQRLQGVYRVLKLSRDYRPLQHISWQQPALDTASAKAVHVALYEAAAPLLDDLPPELAAIQIEAAQAEALGEPVFNGFIRVRSGALLHVDVDISYFPPLLKQLAAPAPARPLLAQQGAQAAHSVRLRESRKLKLNEIHYFDHPLFGVILQVSRL